MAFNSHNKVHPMQTVSACPAMVESEVDEKLSTTMMTEEGGIFNISYVRKNDLPEIASKSSAATVLAATSSPADPSSVTHLIDENIRKLTELQLERPSATTAVAVESTTAIATTPQTFPLTTPTATATRTTQSPPSPAAFVNVSNETSSCGDGNVLRKVASLSNASVLENATKTSRPTFVPEKLNFSAYEKFEGQMLMNWLFGSFQCLTIELNENQLTTLTLQYCTNLLVAGVIKQISDKHAPTQETFKPNLMYQWTHTEAPSPMTLTPGKLEAKSIWPHCTATRKLTLGAPKPAAARSLCDLETRGGQELEDLVRVKERLIKCNSVSELRVLLKTLAMGFEESDVRPIDEQTNSILPDALNDTDVTVFSVSQSESMELDDDENNMNTPTKKHRKRRFSKAGLNNHRNNHNENVQGSDNNQSNNTLNLICANCTLAINQNQKEVNSGGDDVKLIISNESQIHITLMCVPSRHHYKF